MIGYQLLAYLNDFLTPERKERFLEVLAERTKYITVAIEDVFQMHNASAVIRSCDIFGLQEVHVIENRNCAHFIVSSCKVIQNYSNAT